MDLEWVYTLTNSTIVSPHGRQLLEAGRPIAAATTAITEVTGIIRGIVEVFREIESKLVQMGIGNVKKLYSVIKAVMDFIDDVTAPFDSWFFSFLEEVTDVFEKIT
jgi:hypothetical protein